MQRDLLSTILQRALQYFDTGDAAALFIPHAESDALTLASLGESSGDDDFIYDSLLALGLFYWARFEAGRASAGRASEPGRVTDSDPIQEWDQDLKTAIRFLIPIRAVRAHVIPEPILEYLDEIDADGTYLERRSAGDALERALEEGSAAAYSATMELLEHLKRQDAPSVESMQNAHKLYLGRMAAQADRIAEAYEALLPFVSWSAPIQRETARPEPPDYLWEAISRYSLALDVGHKAAMNQMPAVIRGGDSEPQSANGQPQDVRGIVMRKFVDGVYIAQEVHDLIVFGFGPAATARTRALHEITVVAAFLVKYAHYGDHKDLPARYEAARMVNLHRHLQELAEVARSSGVLTKSLQQEVVRARVDAERVMAQYGADLRRSYGWAAPVLGANTTFTRLQAALGDAELDRRTYTQLSWEVHGGPAQGASDPRHLETALKHANVCWRTLVRSYVEVAEEFVGDPESRLQLFTLDRLVRGTLESLHDDMRDPE